MITEDFAKVGFLLRGKPETFEHAFLTSLLRLLGVVMGWWRVPRACFVTEQ